MKKMHTKLTDPAEVGTWLSGVIALLMHYGGEYVLPPEAVGAMLTAALLPVAMAAIRLVSRALSQIKDDVNPPSSEAGFASIAFIPYALVVGILLMMLLEGCGANYHLKKGGWKLEKADCGTQLTVYGDGDPAVSVICIKDSAPLKLGDKLVSKICGTN